jgi:hypothetical protein
MGKPDSTATLNYNGHSTQPGITEAERIRRKREEQQPNLDNLPAPDLADTAAKEQTGFLVRRARGSSTARAFGRFDSTTPFTAQSALRM